MIKSTVDRLKLLLVLGIAIEFFAMIAAPLYSIPFHISRNYNEGWNAYFAQAAINGGILYPSEDSMMTNNYPPLSFYIIGAVGKVVGDNVVAGRIIAFVALIVIARNVFSLCRWLGADRMLAGMGMGLLLLGIYTLMPQYIALNDPGFLAHAFITTAVLLFLTASDVHLWRKMAFAALLMIMGGLIKHSTISMPLALCSYAAFNDRRRLVVFVVSSIAIGLTVCMAAYLIWGIPMIDSVLFGARQKSILRSVFVMRHDLAYIWPYILMTLVAWFFRRDRREFSFTLWYLAWSIFGGFLMLSGAGVNQNVLCDAVIALSLGAVIFYIAMADFSSRLKFDRSEYHIVLSIIIATPWMVTSLLTYLTSPYITTFAQILDAPKWEELSETLAHAKGPVACETLAICYWAHKPMEIDFFNYGQRLLTGSVYADDPSGFLAKIAGKKYDYIVIERNPGRLPRFLMEDMFKNYEPPKSPKLITRDELFLIPRR